MSAKWLAAAVVFCLWASVLPVRQAVAQNGLSIGMTAVVINDGLGLNLRAEPDLNAQVIGFNYDHAQVYVMDGPRYTSGYEWWLISSPAGTGWSVGKHLYPYNGAQEVKTTPPVIVPDPPILLNFSVGKAQVHPGESFEVWYDVRNPSSVGKNVWLGLSIIPTSGGNRIDDSHGDTFCYAPPYSTAATCHRSFTVPAYAQGRYTVQAAIWSDTPPNATMYDIKEMYGYLEVQPSSSDIDGGDPSLLIGTYVFPVPEGYQYDPLSQDFGAPRSWSPDGSVERTHEGQDIMAPIGTPLVAVGSGTIVRKGWSEYGGWHLLLQLDSAPEYRVYYAHLIQYAENLSQGDWVPAGRLLGYVGDTGYGPENTRGTFPPHLHLGLYKNGGAMNPFPYLKAWESNRVRLP